MYASLHNQLYQKTWGRHTEVFRLLDQDPLQILVHAHSCESVQVHLHCLNVGVLFVSTHTIDQINNNVLWLGLQVCKAYFDMPYLHVHACANFLNGSWSSNLKEWNMK